MSYSRPKAFFFHFNKPRSRALGKPQISVHIDGACHIVDNVVCEVKTSGRIRRTQPVFVMAGRARSFVVEGGVGRLS